MAKEKRGKKTRGEKIRVQRVEEEAEEAAETRGEDKCEKETGRETRSGGSGFMPRIDNLDVKSYICRMCLSVTY